MARTVGQVVAAARAIVQDEGEPYRVSTAQMAGYVSEALGEARRVRPDLFARNMRDEIPYYTGTMTDLARVIPLQDYFFVPLVNYVSGRADLREDRFAVDNRAMTLISAFGAAMRGTGS